MRLLPYIFLFLWGYTFQKIVFEPFKTYFISGILVLQNLKAYPKENVRMSRLIAQMMGLDVLNARLEKTHLLMRKNKEYQPKITFPEN